MYACICAAVTDRAVETAVRCGARTLRDVDSATRAGSGCGSCHDHLCDIIERLTDAGASAAAAS
jgi:bacterioferritin-associated ferredoxin